MTLVVPWYGTGTLLVITWYSPGNNLVLRLYSPDNTLLLPCNSPGNTLIIRWYTLDTTLVINWYSPGNTLVTRWYRPGSSRRWAPGSKPARASVRTPEGARTWSNGTSAAPTRRSERPVSPPAADHASHDSQVEPPTSTSFSNYTDVFPSVM